MNRGQLGSSKFERGADEKNDCGLTAETVVNEGKKCPRLSNWGSQGGISGPKGGFLREKIIFYLLNAWKRHFQHCLNIYVKEFRQTDYNKHAIYTDRGGICEEGPI